MIHTKFICTIGPSVRSLEKIMALMEAGMNVARLNFSHGTHEEHLEVIHNLKEARRLLNKPLAIMLDTKGTEIRLGKIENNELKLRAGDIWKLVKESLMGNAECVTINPAAVLNQLKEGMQVLFDDGYISSQVVKVTSEAVYVKIENDGIIRSGKGVNVPNVSLDLPAFTEKDIVDIRFGCEQDIELIAASFVRSVDHVLAIKRLLAEENKSDILVIAKIENHEGVQNFDSIVQVADGIMIARGDLGVEVPLSQVPKLQKMMIRKCYLEGKPSVTATQMLESMINNPRPTRAEVSDVANAIYDSTSAVMLSGETAVGKYPLETMYVMTSIVKEAEEDFDYRAHFDYHSRLVYNDVPSSVTLACVKTAYSANAKAIFVFTSSGSTARLISRLRPSMPIIAMTPNEKSYHQLTSNWGVIPFLSVECVTVEEAFKKICVFALEKKLVSEGDLVVITAGTPFGVSGTTNMMIVESIGDVLVRGEKGLGKKMHGKVSLALSPDAKKAYAIRDNLLVIAKCNESYLPMIEECKGIILQNKIDDEESENYAIEVAKRLEKSLILRADGAFRILKDGQLVTLDPDKALVYKGIVV